MGEIFTVNFKMYRLLVVKVMYIYILSVYNVYMRMDCVQYVFCAIL